MMYTAEYLQENVGVKHAGQRRRNESFAGSAAPQVTQGVPEPLIRPLSWLQISLGDRFRTPQEYVWATEVLIVGSSLGKGGASGINRKRHAPARSLDSQACTGPKF
jgi:hypothetical protein